MRFVEICTKRSVEMQNAELLRRMVDGPAFPGDHIPGQVMGLSQQVTAFVEVCPDGFAGRGGETGEESADKAVGDPEADAPAALMEADRGIKQLLLLVLNGDQAGQLINGGAEAQEHTSVGIEFKVEVAQVALLWAEEKLQTAIAARHSQRISLFPPDLPFVCGQTDQQGIFRVADLGVGSGIRFQGQNLFPDRYDRDSFPINGFPRKGDIGFVHIFHPFLFRSACHRRPDSAFYQYTMIDAIFQRCVFQSRPQ